MFVTLHVYVQYCMCTCVVHTLKSHVCLFEYCHNELLHVAAMHDNGYSYEVALYGERVIVLLISFVCSLYVKWLQLVLVVHTLLNVVLCVHTCR